MNLWGMPLAGPWVREATFVEPNISKIVSCEPTSEISKSLEVCVEYILKEETLGKLAIENGDDELCE